MPRGDHAYATRGVHRLGDEREVGVERLGDVVRERAQERFADDAGGAGRDGAQKVALAGRGAGVGDGFEEGGQCGRGDEKSREPRW